MSSRAENIHPIFHRLLQRADKEKLLRQRAKVFWMTGLSGSGKSTIAQTLERRLHELGYLTQILDGDNVRSGINKNLSFSEADRMENIRRIAEISKLFVNCGVITINCFVSPTLKMRALAQSIIGEEDFVEIYINAPFEVCEQRDVKGLYAKARKGEIKNFTGLDAPFEAPVHPSLEVRTDQMEEAASVEAVLQFVLPQIKHK